jgi:plasmid maintenance system antidote protein VapI
MTKKLPKRGLPPMHPGELLRDEILPALVNGPDLWLNLQKRYDLQRAAEELGDRIKAIPTLEVA